jgi:hypothetical protein
MATAAGMGFDDSTRARHGLCLRLAATGYLLLVPVALRLQTSFAAAVTPTKRCITASAHGSPQASAVCAAVTCALHSLVLALCPVASSPPTAVLLPVSPVPSAVAVRCVDPGPGLELWPQARHTCRLFTPQRPRLPLAIAPAHPAMKAGPVGVGARLQQCAMCAIRRRIPLPARRPVASVPRRSLHGAAVAPTWRPSSALDE